MIKIKAHTEIPLVMLLSIASFSLGTVILALSLARVLVTVEAFVVLGSSLPTPRYNNASTEFVD